MPIFNALLTQKGIVFYDNGYFFSHFFRHLRTMFNRLRKKWNVSWLQFILIFSTFALGGSLCGYTGRKLLSFLAIEQPWIRIPLYIVLITLIWPFCVLLISIPLGQFSFFKKYLGRLGRRIAGKSISS